MPRITTVLVLLICGSLLAGCSSRNTGGVSGLSNSESDALNAKHSRFESSEDPPLAVETRFAAGKLAESQADPAKAIEQYQAAIKLDAHHLPSLYRLGVLYAQLKAFPQAIETWKAYVNEVKDDATGYSNLGFCHELANQPTEAEAAYRQGLQRDATNVPCRVKYGLMLARLGRTNEAIAQLQTVLPEAQVHYNLASIYELQGHADQARQEYRKALEINPHLQDAEARLAALE